MRSLSFLTKEIEANQTVIIEEVDGLDLNRLLDTNDDYNSILFSSQKEIVVKNGELVFAIPEPKEVDTTQTSEEKGDDDDQTAN